MSSPSVWNPTQYDRYKAERSQPFWDLAALVRARAGMRVVDLGCGTGELTAVLHERLGAAETLGLDNSSTMLAKAAPLALAAASGTLRFDEAEIEAFPARAGGGNWDLIFSNAALHWVADHDALFARLAGALASGGQLAVQVPANFDHPSHTLARDVALEAPFVGPLGGYTRGFPVAPPEHYATLLHKLGFAEQHVRLQVYGHVLPGREDVIEWVKGTLLTDYQKRLPAELFPAFLARFRERLFEVIPDERPYFYPFKRILLWGVKP